MTFRELFKQQHGYDVVINNPLSLPCPHKFGYEHKNPEVCRRMLDCKSCWEREVPQKEPTKWKIEKAQKAADAAAHSEVNDNVSHPKHYTAGKIECIDCIESIIAPIKEPEQAFLAGQIIKYVARYTLKNGAEDLQKAKWYLDRLIDKVKPQKDAERGD